MHAYIYIFTFIYIYTHYINIIMDTKITVVGDERYETHRRGREDILMICSHVIV